MPGKASNMMKIIESAWAKLLGAAAVLALLAAGGRLVLAQVRSENELVAEVHVAGNQNIPTPEIMSYIQTRPGMDFNKSHIYQDVTRLLESRKFRDVRPEWHPVSNGVAVTFNIVEWPNTVLEVIFRHAKHISQKDLEDMTKDVRKGLPMNPSSNIKAARDIQDYLKNAKGRYWANVILEEGARPTDRRRHLQHQRGPGAARPLHRVCRRQRTGQLRPPAHPDRHQPRPSWVWGAPTTSPWSKATSKSSRNISRPTATATPRSTAN